MESSGKARDIVTALALVGLLLTAITNGVAGAKWLFGGAAASDAAIVSLTQSVSRLDDKVDKLGRQIEAAPRVVDFADRDRRLGELGSHVELDENRLTRTETDLAALRASLTALIDATRIPVRNPR
jgi:hypothetical protein